MSKSAEKLPVINGYQLLESWSTSGSARWSFAEKDGSQWFIKQFMAPKFKRVEDGVSETKVEKARIRCEAFRSKQTALYDRIRASQTGNIVQVEDFFDFESIFYAVTKRVDISSVSLPEVAEMDHRQKMNLLKVLTYNIMSLHKNGVIHADLKPDNILIKKTLKAYTMKLIDFDASFLEAAPREGEELAFDVNFVAPETVRSFDGEEVSLTTKLDVFALGLIFHLYYTGRFPAVPEEFSNACDAVSEGIVPEVDPDMPDWLGRLISAMILLEPEERPSSAEVFESLAAQAYPVVKEELIPEKLPITDIPLKSENPPKKEKKGFGPPIKIPARR